MKSLFVAVAALTLAVPFVTAAPDLLPEPAPPAIAAVHHVHMGPPSIPGAQLGFSPSPLQVAPGDVIQFHSHFFHTANSGIDTSTEGLEALLPAALHMNAFSTGVVISPNTVSVTLTDPGLYLYYCQIGNHRNMGMRAAIVVGA